MCCARPFLTAVCHTLQAHDIFDAMQVPGYHVAYVGNIAFDVEESSLRDIFDDCGVLFVRLHTDKHSGRSKGFAHVHFPDSESLDRAVAKDGAELSGRNLRVSYAQPKKDTGGRRTS